MAKTTSTTHRCSECGWSTTRWVGRCGRCQAWGSLLETAPAPPGGASSSRPVTSARRITDVAADPARSIPTGIAELDRVLGKGLVPGAVVLLGGEPGVGKSTLLLAVAARWAGGGRPTLYVSAEESAAQVRLRADRTGSLSPHLYVAAEADLGTILGHVEELSPSLLVLDSVQTVSAGQSEGVAGGVTQVREVTGALVRVAKQRGMAVLIIGHVTKDGAIAGPRTLEHLVDVVLTFEGDRHSGFRMVRSTKNRYGPSDEVGCFELTDGGIREVPDPSGLFTSRAGPPASGTCATVSLEGRRPLVAEFQALVAPAGPTGARRVAHGLDLGRVTMTLAVLQRRARLKLHHRDVFVSTVGGVRVADPTGDLATALAVATAFRDAEPRTRLVALGEIGLSGELRPVAGAQRRLAEAQRLGFEVALVSAGSLGPGEEPPNGLLVVEVATLAAALDVVFTRLTRPTTADVLPLDSNRRRPA